MRELPTTLNKLRLATVLVGLLLAVLPAAADDIVQIQPQPGDDSGFDPHVLNGLLSDEFPSVGVILEGSREANVQFCTGTLIGCNTFLTAAHCLCSNYAYCEGHDVSTGFVYFPNGGVYGVSAVDIHPDFQFPTADIAIVTLSEPVTGITPTRINDVGPVAPGSPGTIVGYGVSDSLGRQGVKYSGRVDPLVCLSVSDFPDDEHLCWEFLEPIGEPGEDSNTCYGDSGGPMFVDMAAPGSAESDVVVAGVTSGGFGCEADTFAFDTNVYHYRQFIQDVAGDDLGTESCGDLPPVGGAGTLVESASGRIGEVQSHAVHEFQVPPDLELMRVSMNASDWDFQNFVLTVSQGKPSEDQQSAACYYREPSNWTVCEIENPVAGTWYATVRSLQGPGVYQVTATMFGSRANSGDVRVAITPATQAVSPGGVMPYTVEIRNITEEFRSVKPRWRILSPAGDEYLFGPYDRPLEPGEAWIHQGRIGSFLNQVPGPWTLIIETTGSDESYDRDWTSFALQSESAVAVRLSSPDALLRPGESWSYAAELQNVTGRPLVASATWTITDPDGNDASYGPYSISLAPGQTWQRDMTIGPFPENPLGAWTVTVETEADGFVDQDSLQVELLPFGQADFQQFEDLFCIHGMTPDGRTMVGDAGYLAGAFVWTEETGAVTLEDPEATARDISDDGSVILGTTMYRDSTRGWFTASIWTEAEGWQMLPWMTPPINCGFNHNTGYDLSGDGTTVVGLGWYDGCEACAFHWTEDTGIQCLPGAVDSWATRANTVSSDGTIVMGWDGYDQLGYRRAARWTADNPSDPFTSFTETLIGSPWYSPDPVNGPGEVLAMTPDGSMAAGDTGVGDFPEYSGGFHWSDVDGFQDLDALQDNWGTWPSAMTPDGAVVIGGTGNPYLPTRTAFIWTEETGMIALQDRVEALGADIGNLSGLTFATDISDDGTIISGCTPFEGSWVFTMPNGEAQQNTSASAGSGQVVVRRGVPVRLPAGSGNRVGMPNQEVGESDAQPTAGPSAMQMK